MSTAARIEGVEQRTEYRSRRAMRQDARTAPPRTLVALPARRRGRRPLLSALVMTFAAGLVATLALPSYAVNLSKVGSTMQVNGRTVDRSGEQVFKAADALPVADVVARDTFTATSSAELERAQYAVKFSSYSGPSAEDYIKNPDHPPFSLDAVYNDALQYRGVPYVFGGADPSGFDCSGFIMFVYAKFGVALPHSVRAQDAIGMHIAPGDAQAGDVVVFNDDSHDGFYAGDGMILHAPFPGARVRVQPIWTTNVHFVRFGAN